MTVGQRIRNRRLELKISVSELSEKIEKNRATVYRYENDSVEPSITQLLKIAKALNTSTGYLLGDTDDPNDDSWLIRAFDLGIQELSSDAKIKNAVKHAEKEHLKALYSICEGDANFKTVTEMYNREFLPTRINIVTEFILANKDILKATMPGITRINGETSKNK